MHRDGGCMLSEFSRHRVAALRERGHDTPLGDRLRPPTPHLLQRFVEQERRCDDAGAAIDREPRRLPIERLPVGGQPVEIALRVRNSVDAMLAIEKIRNLDERYWLYAPN